jgi:hypothetical protein
MMAFAIWLGGMALMVLIWLLFRPGGYKRQPLDMPPGPDWLRTEERFIDPTTGETLDVWYHPRNGERACVRARSMGPTGQA